MEPQPAAAGSDRSGPRFVVFTGSLNHGVRKGIVAIDDATPGAQWLVCVMSRPRTWGKLWRGQWKNLKRNGWRWLTYQSRELLKRALTKKPMPHAGQGTPGHEFSLERLRSLPHVQIRSAENLHAPEMLDGVRAFKPDLGLSLGGPILKRSLFALPRLGTVNLHKGRLPDFRGMPPAFWELWHDQDAVGCSVHMVDDGLDTGALLGETVVQRQRHSSVRGLQLELDEVAITLTRDCVLGLLDGTAVPRPQPQGQGRTFRKPTLQQEKALASKLAAPVTPARRLRAWVKDGIAMGLIGGWHLGARRLMPPHVTVLNYHHVTDSALDNLSITLEQFDRHMAWAASNCKVVPIEEVLAMDGGIPPSSRPLVCITFDDGYLDNWKNAAPILRRHGLPASFFVSTGIVGTDAPFPHDIRRGNGPIPNMNWDQLHQMRQWGFTIGSHTVNHIDCAGEAEDVVRRELRQAREDLERELGIKDIVFAYPYGGRDHMTPERLELVKQAGYAGCLSAHGGINVKTVDRWNVLRCSDGWEFSDLAFQRRCLGLL